MESKPIHNLGESERLVRIVTGILITTSVLFIPLGAEGIATVCLVALYPLFTGLLAIDPFFKMFAIAKRSAAIYTGTAKSV